MTNEAHDTVNKKCAYWLFTVNIDGTLNVILINGLELRAIYSISKFNQAPRLIKAGESTSSESALARNNSIIETPNQPNVSELLTVCFGVEKNRLYLISKMDEDLIIYEAFLSGVKGQGLSTTKRLNLKRVAHDIIIRDKRRRKSQLAMSKKTNELNLLKTKPTSSDDMEQWVNMNADYLNTRGNYVHSIKCFNGIANLSGFSINGAYPYLVFYCARSGLTPHPLWIDGPIATFCQLKNTSITVTGFIYVNSQSNVRLCSLPLEDPNGKLQIHYDSAWILKKVQIRQTIHFLCYHEESKTYAVVYTTVEPSNKLMQLGDEDKEVNTAERDENFVLPTKGNFYVQLYTPTSWEALPLGKYDLADWEHVSSFKLVKLPYEGHSSGFKSYLAASTVYCYNEDVNSRGRIIILDVVETVPEPDKPLTNIKIKIILEKEQKGPVTCLESVNGYLIGCVGQKVFIWEYKNDELLGKAFIDTHFYIHKMITLKEFVLIADIHRSISLIRFQNEYKKLSFVAKVSCIFYLNLIIKIID